MFAKSAVSFAKPIRATMSRRTVVSNAGLPGFLYNSVWAKSTARYVSTVIIGLVAADYVFHQFFESLWDASNKGVSEHNNNVKRYIVPLQLI